MSTVITGTDITVDNVVVNTGVDSPSVAIGGNEVSPFGFRNFFINGGFDIWQRGTSFNITTSGYTADRWLVRGESFVGGTVNASFSHTFGVDNHIKIDHVGGTSNGYIGQKIEGKKLLGKTVTYSCEVFVDNACDFALRRITLENAVSTSDLITAKTSVIAGSWVKLEFTVTIPNATTSTLDASDHLGIYLQYYGNGVDAVGTNSIRVRKVQLEEGSIATPFEKRPIGLEKTLCMRYMQVLANTSAYGQIGIFQIVASTALRCVMKLSTPMRTNSPSIVGLSANIHAFPNIAAVGTITQGGIIVNGESSTSEGNLLLNLTTSGATADGSSVIIRKNNDTTLIYLHDEL